MVRVRDREIAKEKFYAVKSPINICDVNVDNIVISKLVKTKTKYFTGYLDKAIKPLALIIPKMSKYVKTFKVMEGDNKSMSFCIYNEKLLEKYTAI